jgi:16S rRNA processing protein RimM
VSAGRVAGVFGLRGELKVAATRIGADALKNGMTLTVTLTDGTAHALRVRSLRIHQDRPLIAFDGYADATAAQALVGATLSIPRDDVRLARGEYFDEDLIGCVLVDERSGAELCTVASVEHYPAQDMLVVLRQAQHDKASSMVPMVREFVKRIDVAAKRITVALPPGLLNLSEATEA